MFDHGARLGRFALCAMLALSLAACGADGTLIDSASSGSADKPPAATPPANSIPVISGEPALTAKAGVSYSFVPSASDADQETLTFSVTGLPAWASFDAATGALTGTPGDTNVGQTGDIEIGVSDGKAESTIGPFRIQVLARDATPSPTNTAPVISGTPATLVVATKSYIFMPMASDADNDSLTFSIANRPQWAAFDAATGQLSGTPTRTDAKTFSSIIITVSDGKTSTSLPAFSIQVQAAPNTAPTVSGAPSTSVQAGTAYSFKPTAADADKDTLSFSITNKPAWATFSIATGTLSGTPTAAQVGTYAGIVISVSDGKTTASLAAFQINVTGTTSTGSATLTWSAPSTNVDGTAISSLGGYRIYYGTSASNLAQSMTISDPLATSATVTGLSAATWYFSVTAFTSDGMESAQTTPVSKTVN